MHRAVTGALTRLDRNSNIMLGANDKYAHIVHMKLAPSDYTESIFILGDEGTEVKGWVLGHYCNLCGTPYHHAIADRRLLICDDGTIECLHTDDESGETCGNAVGWWEE